MTAETAPRIAPNLAPNLAAGIARTIAAEIAARPEQVAAAAALLDGGATAPFVARCREAAAGASTTRGFAPSSAGWPPPRELEARRAGILGSIRDQGELTPEREGTVTNVAAFGAFLDIGVRQDGLVHVSQLAGRFVKDPHAVVKAGDVVKLRVVEVDVTRKRIDLTMRKDAPRPEARRAPQGKPQPPGKRERAPKAETPAEAGTGSFGAAPRDAPKGR